MIHLDLLANKLKFHFGGYVAGEDLTSGPYAYAVNTLLTLPPHLPFP